SIRRRIIRRKASNNLGGQRRGYKDEENNKLADRLRNGGSCCRNPFSGFISGPEWNSRRAERRLAYSCLKATTGSTPIGRRPENQQPSAADNTSTVEASTSMTGS